MTEPDDASAVSRVDVTRHLKQLGWEGYGYDLITDVLGIPGHHFSVFASEHVSNLSSQLFGSAAWSFLVYRYLAFVAYLNRSISLPLESNKRARC